MSATTRDKVFISYSHKDKKWLERLQTMLQPLVRSRAITIWDDTLIKPGGKWKEDIQCALAAASTAVLLVSDNFLASPFIAEHELPPLLTAAENEGLTILWILVSACLYQETEISEYQAAYDPSQPLDSLSAARRKQALAQIGQRIKAVANRQPTELEAGGLSDPDPIAPPPIWTPSVAVPPGDLASLTDKERYLLAKELLRSSSSILDGGQPPMLDGVWQGVSGKVSGVWQGGCLARCQMQR